MRKTAHRIRHSIKLYFGIVLLLLFATAIYASMGGITGKTNLSGGDGCTCHSSSSSEDVTVSIIGPDEVEVNATADYRVEISGGPLVKGGTNIAASSGVLVAGTLLRLQSGELTHQAPVDAADNKVVFDFKYTAPATEGTITLYATGNSVDGGGNSFGDMWNHAPDKQITITNSVTAVNDNRLFQPETFSLSQNYPNPFNPATTIPFSLKKRSFVTLRIYDLLGQEIATVLEDYRDVGRHTIPFNAATLKSGSYVYRLTTDAGSMMKKMVVVK